MNKKDSKSILEDIQHEISNKEKLMKPKNKNQNFIYNDNKIHLKNISIYGKLNLFIQNQSSKQSLNELQKLICLFLQFILSR